MFTWPYLGTRGGSEAPRNLHLQQEQDRGLMEQPGKQVTVVGSESMGCALAGYLRHQHCSNGREALLRQADTGDSQKEIRNY